MKKINILIAILAVFISCKQENRQSKEAQESVVTETHVEYGAPLGDLNGQTVADMSKSYAALIEGDSISTVFKAKVVEVCQAKGCWMQLDMGEGQTAMVRFKDYGFFVPKDLSGREVVVKGLAFVEEQSVEDQRHFAQDGGAAEEEIAAITAPLKTFSFEAEGVRVLD